MDKRTVLHVDMDAFYASVEQHDNPRYRGRAVIVGGAAKRGVVCAASYEARRFGVRSAMSISEAQRRCPDGVYLPVRMARYQEVSRRIFAEFYRLTPLVEGLSLDEAFLDITASRQLFGAPLAVGAALKARIRDTTGLTASIGIGPNKLLAKFASELGKPDGLREIGAAQAVSVLDPLPVGDLWGIGRKTAPRLQRLGIRSIGDLRRAHPARLRSVLGRYAEHYQRLATGLDERPVIAAAADKSVSNETTFADDIADPGRLEVELLALTDSVSARLRRRKLTARTVTLKIREADFTTRTRSRSFDPPAQDTQTLFAIARRLLRDWQSANPDKPLRLLGVGTSNFAALEQLDMFPVSDTAGRLDGTVDAVRSKFGMAALRRGRLLDDPDTRT